VIAMSETPAGVSESFGLWVVPALRSSFIEHADALVRLAGLLTRDPDAAQEIVQEAFVRLMARCRGCATPTRSCPTSGPPSST
jgi:hypothetical protein